MFFFCSKKKLFLPAFCHTGGNSGTYNNINLAPRAKGWHSCQPLIKGWQECQPLMEHEKHSCLKIFCERIFLFVTHFTPRLPINYVK